MNKKGNFQFVGLGGLIFLILIFFGIKGFFEEDLPAISDKLKKEICIPIQDKNNICFF